jgi:hypothetical protein
MDYIQDQPPEGGTQNASSLYAIFLPLHIGCSLRAFTQTIERFFPSQGNASGDMSALSTGACLASS